MVMPPVLYTQIMLLGITRWCQSSVQHLNVYRRVEGPARLLSQSTDVPYMCLYCTSTADLTACIALVRSKSRDMSKSVSRGQPHVVETGTPASTVESDVQLDYYLW